MANLDVLAARDWRGLSRKGLSVPDDVAIPGFDEAPVDDGVGLTTVGQTFEESGRVTFELLLSIVAGTSGPVRRVDFTPTLIVPSIT